MDYTLLQLAQAVGEAVKIPARALPRTQVQPLWGDFLTNFVDYENHASSEKGRREIGWRPQAAFGMLDDIKDGSYRPLATQLRQN